MTTHNVYDFPDRPNDVGLAIFSAAKAIITDDMPRPVVEYVPSHRADVAVDGPSQSPVARMWIGSTHKRVSEPVGHGGLRLVGGESA